MYYTCDRSSRSVIDARHSSGKSASRGNAPEERGDDIGDSLTYELSVGIVLLTGDTVCHHCSQQTLDGTEDCDCKGRGDEVLDGIEIHRGCDRLGKRQTLGELGELAAYGCELHHAALRQHYRHGGACNQGYQRTGDLFESPAVPGYDDKQAAEAQGGLCQGNGAKIAQIAAPLGYKARRDIDAAEAEEILHLGREDRKGDTAGKADHYRVGNELEHCSKFAYTHHYQYDSRHYGGYRKSLDTILSDDRGHDYDEGSGRASNKEARTSENRYQETGHDGCDKALLGADSARYTKSDCKGKGDDADNYSGNEICDETLTVVPAFFEKVEKFR